MWLSFYLSNLTWCNKEDRLLRHSYLEKVFSSSCCWKDAWCSTKRCYWCIIWMKKYAKKLINFMFLKQKTHIICETNQYFVITSITINVARLQLALLMIYKLWWRVEIVLMLTAVSFEKTSTWMWADLKCIGNLYNFRMIIILKKRELCKH